MCNCVIDNSMVNKRFIPQITTPEIKANWKDYQVEDAFLSMKGDKKKWSEQGRKVYSSWRLFTGGIIVGKIFR